MAPLNGRQKLLAYVAGRGLEIGPGHVPAVATSGDIKVRYVDRWEPDESQELFPELQGATFPRPDLVRNLDTDLLGGVPSESEDFVVASHVLEHLANPMRVLADCFRVLRPGGVMVIVLPDRRLTFDKGRPPTPLEHLVKEFHDEVEEVSEAHVVEFLAHMWKDPSLLNVQSDDPGRIALLEHQRRRSIHVHCWTMEEFAEVIAHSIGGLGQAWEFVDAIDVEEGSTIEFGFVLRRTGADIEATRLQRRFEDAFESWAAAETLQTDLAAARSALQAAEQQVVSLSEALAEAAAALAALQSTRTFRYSRVPREIYGKVRQLAR